MNTLRFLYIEYSVVAIILMSTITAHLKYQFLSPIGLYIIIGSSVVVAWVSLALVLANRDKVGDSKHEENI